MQSKSKDPPWLNDQIKGAFSGLKQFSPNESSSKTIKKDFYFVLETPFVLKIFKFGLDFLVVQKKLFD